MSDDGTDFSVVVPFAYTFACFGAKDTILGMVVGHFDK
jgi:hypothetical protein